MPATLKTDAPQSSVRKQASHKRCSIHTHTLKIGKCNLLTNCATHVGLWFQLLPQQSALAFGCAYLKGKILVIKFFLNVINAPVRGLEGKKKERHVTGEADSTRLCRVQSWKLGRFCTAPIRSERDTFKPKLEFYGAEMTPRMLDESTAEGYGFITLSGTILIPAKQSRLFHQVHV